MKYSSSVNFAQNILPEIFRRCRSAYSAKTLSGYRNDLQQFSRWCEEQQSDCLPAKPETVAAFVDAQARSLCIATIKRRVEAIKFAHAMCDLPSPAFHSEVKLALRRAARMRSARPEQSLGLTRELLGKLLVACPDTLAGKRDAALLSIGYDTLCRSWELTHLRVENLSEDRLSILIPRSKSDQFGHGRLAYLSPGARQYLSDWLAESRLVDGPLFQGLHTNRPSGRALNTSSVRRIIKRLAEKADLDAHEVSGLSGHSMRIGAAQDMMVAGLDHLAIMQAGGWKSINVLARYVEHSAARRIHETRWQRMPGHVP